MQIPSFAFDSSVEDIFTPLISGSQLIIIDQEKRLDMNYLNKTIINNEVTHFLVTPALYNTMLTEGLTDVKTLTKITVAGEHVNEGIVEKHFKLLKDVRLFNEYGPTENSVCSTVYEFTSNDKRVLIGKPISNTKLYIVDSCNNLLPIGVAGELCISGEGLSDGYLNKSELTKEKFVDNPFKIGSKMYRTGDLAKWLPDGNIEFLGRIDNQVKIRGYRIEVEEIENRLLEHEDIKEAVVIAKENENKEKYLCAYVVSEKSIEDLILRNYLRISMPEYMIPAYFVSLEKMPLTTNGKVDKRALPEPKAGSNLNEYEAPRNAIQEILVKIWREILEVETIGISDNFFELGGHSLKAAVLASRIHKELNKKIELKELFKSPTIKALSEILQDREENLYSSIEKVTEREYYEASSAQKRMYILGQFDPQSVAYNLPAVFELAGYINNNKFENTFKELVKRHESLRTYFETVQGDIVQKIDNYYDFKLEYKEVEAEIDTVVSQFIRSFDLGKAPLFRVEIVKCQAKTYLLVDMHHIIADGVSMDILIREFASIHNGNALEPLKLQYKDFASWQNAFLKSEKMKREEQYWINIFSDEVPVLNLPIDHERPAIQSFEGDSVSFKVEEDLKENLKKLTRTTGSTMQMILLSAFNILLSKYSNDEDIIVGVPVAGRPHAQLQNIMGMFVNTLPLRNRPEGSKKYIDFLLEVKENSLSAYENQDYQLETLIEKLSLKRDMSRNPLFDVMFSTVDTVKHEKVQLEDVSLKPYYNKNTISKFDLTLNAMENTKDLDFVFEYSTKLFNKETIEKLATHYINILEVIVYNREITLKEIDVLTEKEKDLILNKFNGTKVDYPENKTLQQIFEEQVNTTPNHIAVVYGDEKLTYKELNERSNSLARTLRDKGVRPEKIVGIMVDRSIDMIVGIMAIIKSGAAYMPIDLNYPKERISYLLHNTNVELILTDGNYEELENTNCELINITKENVYSKDKSNLEIINTQDDLLYVLYTSGTTGKPKGVMVEQRNVVNIAYGWINSYELDKFDVNLLQIASMSFDVFTGDLCRALLTGGTMHICPSDIRIDMEELYKTVVKNRISIMESTPSLIIAFMEYTTEKGLKLEHLKLLILGSDSCAIEDYKNLVINYGQDMRIINSYGVTEATIDSSYYEENTENIPNNLVNTPIGRPMQNIKFYVLNQGHKFTPVGVAGELYIGGLGVARGYYNNEVLTKERFIDNPFESGSKMYKTGDLAKWLPDGNLEFLGRIDNQVKLRGFRIELGEIENVLLKHKDIKAAVVLAMENINKEKYLCAYFVSTQDIKDADLKVYLRENLPEYMVPSYLMSIEKMPMTPNGKLDKKALPIPDFENILNEYEPPRNHTEKVLVEIWKEVLKVEKIGISDNFFELGGHSLKATVLMSKVNKELNKTIPLKELFKTPTIKGLSSYLENVVQSPYSEIERVKEKEYYEASSAQKECIYWGSLIWKVQPTICL